MSPRSATFPLIELKIEPKSKTDMAMFTAVLMSLCHNDPNAFCSIDVGNGEVILGGKSEEHLDGVIGALIKQGIAVSIGAPQVAYRETITRKVTKDYSHKRMFGGQGQFARVVLEIEPRERGAGYEFENRASEEAIPRRYLSGVEKGLNSALSAGVIMGVPVVDIKIALIDGAYHQEDSSPLAFEVASRQALREALVKPGSILLQPMMRVEITVPEVFVGSIIGDLNNRVGTIVDTAQSGYNCIVSATVSLSNMLGYSNSLKSLSKGQGISTMSYSHYEAVHGFGGGDGEPDNFPPAVGMRA
jgi:elongation factor G